MRSSTSFSRRVRATGSRSVSAGMFRDLLRGDLGSPGGHRAGIRARRPGPAGGGGAAGAPGARGGTLEPQSAGGRASAGLGRRRSAPQPPPPLLTNRITSPFTIRSPTIFVGSASVRLESGLLTTEARPPMPPPSSPAPAMTPPAGPDSKVCPGLVRTEAGVATPPSLRIRRSGARSCISSSVPSRLLTYRSTTGPTYAAMAVVLVRGYRHRLTGSA